MRPSSGGEEEEKKMVLAVTDWNYSTIHERVAWLVMRDVKEKGKPRTEGGGEEKGRKADESLSKVRSNCDQRAL